MRDTNERGVTAPALNGARRTNGRNMDLEQTRQTIEAMGRIIAPMLDMDEAQRARHWPTAVMQYARLGQGMEGVPTKYEPAYFRQVVEQLTQAAERLRRMEQGTRSSSRDDTNPAMEAHPEPQASIIALLNTRYGGVENFVQLARRNPVGIVADLAAVFGGNLTDMTGSRISR